MSCKFIDFFASSNFLGLNRSGEQGLIFIPGPESEAHFSARSDGGGKYDERLGNLPLSTNFSLAH